MPDDSAKSPGVDLARLILVVVAGAFITAMIVTTGDLDILWPLYLVPIVIAALAFNIAGALLAAAIATALVALLMSAAGFDPAMIPELAVGMVAFFVSGLVIGAQAQRSKRHSRLLEEASILDPLTGLFKREYLNERLAEELWRSERYNLGCSIILVSVDRFDDFKVQFGHYKAEVLLEHLAEILRVTVRSHDILARYGPTTYCIALPMMDAAGAEAVAERVRSTVASADFEGDVLEPVTHCTVSTATATYPEDASRRQELIAIAEQRLEESTYGSTASSKKSASVPQDTSEPEDSPAPAEPAAEEAEEGATGQGDAH